ncbi:MAG: hypothetical protein N2606_01435 [Candidatus Omnitrophica bacterium]|nr:hypothetical protein [Candidatus Omnitrophota bacterium]
MNNYNRHRAIAVLLSFIFAGLGQLYNGHIIKGLIIIGFSVIGLIVIVVSAVFIAYCLIMQALTSLWFLLSLSLFLLSILFIGVIGIYSILDAYKGAEQ